MGRPKKPYDTQGRTYKSWTVMKQRCLNPNDTNWPRYGGAGVGVCSEWLVFEAFLRDMGERPPGTSIDRIDNAEGYSKSNCRWATRSQQQRNKANSVPPSVAAVILDLSAAGLTRRQIQDELQLPKYTVGNVLSAPENYK